MLIAAGWVGDALGPMLFRLLAEYDTARGEHGLAQAELRRRQSEIAELRSRATIAALKADFGPTLAGRWHAKADAAAQELRAVATTAKLLVLMHLKSLAETKEALGRFAIAFATRRRVMHSDEWVIRIAGLALDVFLDPLCHVCHGRGFHGGRHRGEQRIVCRACSSSGRRRISFGEAAGDQADARRFGTALLAEMGRKLDEAGREMRVRLQADIR
jgi:hypothetical protein